MNRFLVAILALLMATPALALPGVGPFSTSYYDLKEQATAPTSAAQPSDYVRIFAGTDGKLYRRYDIGGGNQISELGGGQGEISVVNDRDNAGTGWVASGAGVTVATTSTAIDLPLSPVVPTAIKITPVSGTDYARYRWTQPAALKQRKLKWEWHQRPLSGYASGDLKAEVYKHSDVGTCTYSGGSYTEFNLSTDASGTTSIPLLTGKFTTTFDADDADCYELRIVRVAGTTALNIAGVIVGPGIQPQGAVVGPRLLYLPTYAGFGTVSVSTVYYARSGENLYIEGTFTAGTTDGTTAAVGLPAGLTVASASASQQYPGRWIRGNAGATTRKQGNLLITSAGTGINFASDDQAAAASPFTAQAGSSVVGTGEVVSFFATVPIAQWSGSGTVNVAQNDVEWASNTDNSSAASNTTSFAFGPSGSLIPSGAVGTERSRRVRFSTPIQPNEVFILEFAQGNATSEWLESSQRFPPISQSSSRYGARVEPVTGVATDVDVFFASTGYHASNATYAGNGDPWSDLATWRWRVRKAAGGQAIGFGAASSTGSGLVSREIAPSEGDLDTLTWTSTIDPSGTITKRYKWSQVGKVVTVEWRIEASVAGTAVTSVRATLPTDMPVPSNHSNQSNNEWVTVSGGAILATNSAALSLGGAAGLFKNSGGTYELYIYSGTASVAAAFAAASLSYVVD